jgi:hypothetical protein
MSCMLSDRQALELGFQHSHRFYKVRHTS